MGRQGLKPGPPPQAPGWMSSPHLQGAASPPTRDITMQAGRACWGSPVMGNLLPPSAAPWLQSYPMQLSPFPWASPYPITFNKHSVISAATHHPISLSQHGWGALAAAPQPQPSPSTTGQSSHNIQSQTSSSLGSDAPERHRSDSMTQDKWADGEQFVL